MPQVQFIVHSSQFTVKKIFLAFCFILLATILSGCKAIGTQKPAALQVTSTPEASIFLDGKHLGKTPFFSDQLKEGEYTLKITVSEASFIDKITLAEGTLTVVNRELANNFMAQAGETLHLEKGQKGLFVISMPDKTDLLIDGKFIGKTPYLVEDIGEGEHKVVLSRPGYLEREFAIKASAKYQLIADVTLASEIAKGQSPIASPQPAPEIPKVEILKTPQGFLRVRKEPSLASPEIGRVQTGNQLELVQETEDWLKIKFEGPSSNEADKQGWISAQYTKKL